MPILSEQSSFIDALNFCVTVCRDLETSTKKRMFPILGIVVDTDDPESQRRIKIVDPLLGGNLESGWIEPIRTSQNSDPPLPQKFQTVIVFFINGDPEKGYYLPVINDPNPSRLKNDVLDDSYRIEGTRKTTVDKEEHLLVKENYYLNIDGDKQETVEGDSLISVLGERTTTIAGETSDRHEQTLTIEAGQSIRLATDSGAFISLSASGYVTIQDAFGRRITLGGASGFGEWDLNSLPLRVSNAVSFKINDKEVATVGASVDDGTDKVVTRGW